MAPRGSFAPAPRPAAEDGPMRLLGQLAGWHTTPDPRDVKVVRLALTDAKRRHDPNTGGDRQLLATVELIEDRWLAEHMEMVGR